MAGAHLVVIEDDLDIADLVTSALRDAGFAVTTCRDGEAGLDAALRSDVDLVVLDLMLPGIDGLEVGRRLRARRPDVLILMLTARTAELDRVLGLELAADDYVTKPFSLRELQARVKALLRRRDATSGEASDRTIVRGALTIDVPGQAVVLRGETIELTRREFDLLVLLARHEGTVFSREELLDRVWGAGFDGFAHTVNSHINRLRGKIERDPAHPAVVRTVWGRGYKLVAPDDP
jgi:DNA-binding response OmpR family regulator